MGPEGGDEREKRNSRSDENLTHTHTYTHTYFSVPPPHTCCSERDQADGSSCVNVVAASTADKRSCLLPRRLKNTILCLLQPYITQFFSFCSWAPSIGCTKLPCQLFSQLSWASYLCFPSFFFLSFIPPCHWEKVLKRNESEPQRD